MKLNKALTIGFWLVVFFLLVLPMVPECSIPVGFLLIQNSLRRASRTKQQLEAETLSLQLPYQDYSIHV